MQVFIMAGGKGTRIASVNSTIPKPMIPVYEKPVLQYQIENLSNNGLLNITLIVGHLGQNIVDYFGDGSNFGVNISYIYETQPLGTAGALVEICKDLKEDFLLLNGDIIFQLDFNRLIQDHKQNERLATLVVHPNNHPYDSSIIQVDKNNTITKWVNKEEKQEFYHNLVNAGIHILSPKLFQSFEVNKKLDLDRDVLKPNIETNLIFAYKTPEYIKDMGTPDRYEQVSHEVKLGLINKRVRSEKQRAIFLDRDGVINIYKGFITNHEDMELIPGVTQAIRALNNSMYITIVITNQPVIARGDCTFDELDNIHKKMETLLGLDGAFIDDLYFCPHHPDKGFEGERLEYKINCECRKPKPGMILEAAKQHNIDLSLSYMVGDSVVDLEAAKNAGVTPVAVGESLNNYGNDLTFENLEQFVKQLGI